MNTIKSLLMAFVLSSVMFSCTTQGVENGGENSPTEEPKVNMVSQLKIKDIDLNYDVLLQFKYEDDKIVEVIYAENDLEDPEDSSWEKIGVEYTAEDKVTVKLLDSSDGGDAEFQLSLDGNGFVTEDVMSDEYRYDNGYLSQYIFEDDQTYVYNYEWQNGNMTKVSCTASNKMTECNLAYNDHSQQMVNMNLNNLICFYCDLDIMLPVPLCEVLGLAGVKSSNLVSSLESTIAYDGGSPRKSSEVEFEWIYDQEDRPSGCDIEELWYSDEGERFAYRYKVEVSYR